MRQSFPNPVLVPVLGGQNLIVAVAVQASGARCQIHHFHKNKSYFILPNYTTIFHVLNSGCNTKYCHRDFVLKSVVMGKKGLSGRIGTSSGLFQGHFGTLFVIFIKILKDFKVA